MVTLKPAGFFFAPGSVALHNQLLLATDFHGPLFSFFSQLWRKVGFNGHSWQKRVGQYHRISLCHFYVFCEKRGFLHGVFEKWDGRAENGLDGPENRLDGPEPKLAAGFTLMAREWNGCRVE
jgi:hypothetical protein